jgi:hypothetical protein
MRSILMAWGLGVLGAVGLSAQTPTVRLPREAVARIKSETLRLKQTHQWGRSPSTRAQGRRASPPATPGAPPRGSAVVLFRLRPPKGTP